MIVLPVGSLACLINVGGSCVGKTGLLGFNNACGFFSNNEIFSPSPPVAVIFD